MKIKVIPFGQLKEIIGGHEIYMDADDVDGLQRILRERYPVLETKKYAIAVDRKFVSGNTLLRDQAEVALLPPFSGG